jgi:hypothetical protein
VTAVDTAHKDRVSLERQLRDAEAQVNRYRDGADVNYCQFWCGVFGMTREEMSHHLISLTNSDFVDVERLISRFAEADASVLAITAAESLLATLIEGLQSAKTGKWRQNWP